jgi:hypothetical protein
MPSQTVAFSRSVNSWASARESRFRSKRLVKVDAVQVADSYPREPRLYRVELAGASLPRQLIERAAGAAERVFSRRTQIRARRNLHSAPAERPCHCVASHVRALYTNVVSQPQGCDKYAPLSGQQKLAPRHNSALIDAIDAMEDSQDAADRQYLEPGPDTPARPGSYRPLAR